MPSIKQIISDIGLFKYAASHSQEFPSSTSAKIITLTRPIFYLYEALFLATAATTRGLFTIGKCLVLTSFAILQSLIPSMKLGFLNEYTEFIERYQKAMPNVRKIMYIAVAIFVTLFASVALLNGASLIGASIVTLYLTAFFSLFLEIEFASFLCSDLVEKSLEKKPVFKDLFKALLYLIHAPISPFLSHDYQVKKGLMMPPPDSVENLKHILDNSTGDATRYFLRPEQLKKLPAEDCFEIFKPDFIRHHFKLCSVLSPNDFPKDLIDKIKLYVNKNLMDLIPYHDFINSDLLDSFVDKKLFLDHEHNKLPDNLGTMLDVLSLISTKLNLSVDDLKTFYSNNLFKCMRLLLIALDKNNNLKQSCLPKQNDLIGLFRVYVGIKSISHHPKQVPIAVKYTTVDKKFMDPSYTLISEDIKIMTKGPDKRTIEDFILELFKQKGHFSAFSWRLSKQLTKIRGSKVKGAFNQLVTEFPGLKSDFTELWEMLSGTKKFVKFGETHADIKFKYVNELKIL